MVKLHIKKGDESQFLFETTVQVQTTELIKQLVQLYNGRLKVDRLCQGITISQVRTNQNDGSTEIELLSEHGILLPANMQGLTEDQIVDLKLKDEFASVCIPSGGIVEKKDPVGRRNGMGQ